MSLPLLVNGADCGPVNPLQSLSKTFDRDRGIQQDHFGAGRAGSSKEVFRSPYSPVAGSSQDAARFFSASQSGHAITSPAPAFDLAALNAALPPAHAQTPGLTPQRQMPLSPGSSASWATDFLQHSGKQSPMLQLSTGSSSAQIQTHAQQESIHAQPQQFSPNAMASKFRPFSPMGYGMTGMVPLAAAPFAAQEPISQIDAFHWEREFQSQEAALTTAEQPQQETSAHSRAHDGDELARIAGELVNTVGDAANPKFKNSEFLGLMRQLRDGDVVVDGDKMVPREEASPSAALSSADAKGKSRAVELNPIHSVSSGLGALQNAPYGQASRNAPGESDSAQPHGDYESPIDAYLRTDNEEYIAMQRERDATPAPDVAYEWWNSSQRAQDADWGRLQRDWDSFEATATGIRPLAHYQFQPHNPYVLGEASRTRHHAMHSDARSSIFESVLELEAAVQRDPTDASRWFELGVKQQENEREQKAVQALRRALELEPAHLPSWLALAVSHTNENNRRGTYAAIHEWVERNERYRATVEQFRALNPIDDEMTQTEKFASLIQCLIEMARGDQSGDIDADIQIALAVLLNTNEEYAKARDCFNTALAIRPEDWLLYNRVGATLANSGQPEEALQYYYRALELNPAYIRARFNLGISCINLRRYDEAAQHILDALSLQDGDSVHEAAGGGDQRGVTTVTLWESLKTCCLHMQRLDLANLCDRQDLEAFRSSFHLA